MGTRRLAAGVVLATVCVVGLGAAPAEAQVIKGTSGKDNLHGGAGNDTLYGYGGNDSLDGRRGEDRLFGGAGQDYLADSDVHAVDRYYGGPDGDTINTFYGDTAYGGPGKDIINVGPTTKGTFVDCGRGNDHVFWMVDKPKTKNCEHVEFAPIGRFQANRANGSA